MTGPAAPPPVTARQRKVFAILMLTQLIATLDNQIVATALPTIVGDLGQAEHFSWLVSAYVLAQCAVMPVSGKLGDLIGRKRVMIASLCLFSIGAVGCSASWSMSSLILARLVQGLGTGGILVTVFGMNADLFPPAQRARYQSYLSFVFVFGSFVGPTFGGALTDLVGWRVIFLPTLPLALLAIAGFAVLVPRIVTGRQPVIDYAGALAIAMTVTILVIWTDSLRLFGSFLAPESLFLGIAAGLGLLLSAIIERGAAEPVLPPELLAKWNFDFLSVATFCSGAVTIGLVTYHAYFLQMAHGLTPAQSGLFFIALTCGVSCGALLAGQLMSRDWHFTFPLRLSLIWGVLTLGVFSLLPGGTPIWQLVAVFVAQGFANGLAMNALVFGAQVTAGEGDIGAATGAITLMRTIGCSIGIAVYGSVIAVGLSGVALPEGWDASAITPALLRGLPAAERADLVGHYSEIFAALYRVAAFLALLGFAAACLIRRPAR
ncbi:MFS transporter [Celeribacter indicus]|uniref:MFS permease n=1 Tax=Celeribacter indicus TaxID=1208324 RepID=A0A0B5E7U6_9RHOB|nr:MFS transporter [Celeribacter indicus]AJE49121.1 MFS permease [Celeribacter indicus]SDX16970.1 Predicted arabinose efflux permease, MFS family [Celeribacter indicus]